MVVGHVLVGCFSFPRTILHNSGLDYGSENIVATIRALSKSFTSFPYT